MKKIFTLFAGILFAASLFAADHRPVVKLNSSRNYKIVIDGRSYYGNDMIIPLDRFAGSKHSIKVFEMKKGYFRNRETLVSSAFFRADRNDLVITIDWFGKISIREKRDGRRYGDFDWNDKNDRDRDRRDDYPGRF